MKKILIVDDDKDLLQVLEKRVSSAGYQVLATGKGNEALSLAKKEHPNLILLDIMMPDLDGGRVAEILKTDPQTKDIPIIFLTALFTKGEEAKQGHTIGDNVFVAKPYDSEELLEEIKKHVASD